MTHFRHGLGGRLPLLEPAALSPKQRELYLKIKADIVPWADAAGFKSLDGEGRLIGPFNATLYRPEIGASFLALQKMEEERTSLSKRMRQIVILTVGSVWKAQYEIYAHSSVASTSGLSLDQIEALVGGQTPEGLTEDEQAARRFTQQLVSTHVVEDRLYATAEKAFGPQGIVDMLVLIGCYLTVCALLNAFAVPVPSTQPSRDQERAR